MRVNTYQLLSDKIEEGIRGGLMKCFKRDYLMSAHPDGGNLDEAAVEEIHNYVMNAICEYFNWDDECEP
jgi:hypothetical protein